VPLAVERRTAEAEHARAASRAQRGVAVVREQQQPAGGVDVAGELELALGDVQP
jgi:hypothetical protein